MTDQYVWQFCGFVPTSFIVCGLGLWLLVGCCENLFYIDQVVAADSKDQETLGCAGVKDGMVGAEVGHIRGNHEKH